MSQGPEDQAETDRLERAKLEEQEPIEEAQADEDPDETDDLESRKRRSDEGDCQM